MVNAFADMIDTATPEDLKLLAKKLLPYIEAEKSSDLVEELLPCIMDQIIASIHTNAARIFSR